MDTPPELIDFTAGHPRSGDLDVSWIHGSESAKHNTDPDIQVHAYDEHTFILRQNMAVNYEAPFMFLLFGNARAVLIDTGATASAGLLPAAPRCRRPRGRAGLPRIPATATGSLSSIPIRTATMLRATPSSPAAPAPLWWTRTGTARGNSSDSPALPAIPATTTAATTTATLAAASALPAQVDLGGRVLECWPSPGHHNAAVTFYDPHTGFLLTGDTVYPGRLYIQDWPAFVRTIDRLIGFCSTHPVTHVLGCHIEMSREPGVDYPIFTTYQPDEPPLQMTVEPTPGDPPGHRRGGRTPRPARVPRLHPLPRRGLEQRQLRRPASNPQRPRSDAAAGTPGGKSGSAPAGVWKIHNESAR